MFRLVVLAVALSSVAWAAPASSDLTTNYDTNDGQSRKESVSSDGTITGEYSYVNTDGKLVSVKYTAGKNGFRALGDHLPVEPVAPQSNPAQPETWNNMPKQFKALGDHLPVEPVAPQANPVQPETWNNMPKQQQRALRTLQLNTWNNAPQPRAAATWGQPLQTPQLSPASTWTQTQPQQQWNSQPQQWNSQPQPQQWNAQPQQQWNSQPQPNWQQSQSLQQQQPWLNPVNRIGQQQPQNAKVNFNQQPGQGFSFSVNS